MRRPLLVLAAVLVGVAVAGAPASGVPAQTPKRGGTLVFAGLQLEPACLNLLSERCIPGTSWISLERVYNLVLESPYDVGSGTDSRPRLVSGHEYSKTPPFTLTYHIRPEVRWSDGVPVTARDFVFTHRARLKYIPPEYEDVHRTKVRSIRAVNAKTVQVVLRSRIAGLHEQLFPEVLPEHALRGHDLASVWTTRIDNPRTGKPIGSGPFLVERWERGKQLVLRRNPNYWGPHAAYLDRLVFRFDLDVDGLLASFRRGEIHVAWWPPDPSGFRRERGASFVTTRGAGWEHLSIREGPEGHPALREKRVRRALAYGIDRTAIVRTIFGDVDARIKPVDSMVYLAQSRRYRPNWNAYRLRRVESRRLLEQAGCRRGSDEIYVCAGQRLSLAVATFFSRGGAGSIRSRAVELLQAHLRRVGIEVRPIFVPSAAWFDGYLVNGEWDLALFSWLWAPGSEAELAHSRFACGGVSSVTGYCQRLVTRDLDQARRILDQTRQARVLNRADAQMAKDVPVIPLWQSPIWAALSPTVRGFALSPLPYQLLDAENWWLDR